jgi:asparagine synthase (glutamine-hydrolysing)
VVALLAAHGQHGLATFSIGFDSSDGESGDEYFYSDLVAKTFDTDHHKIHIDTSKLVPAVPQTIAVMSEPMVSHDCVAFYLLSAEVSKSVKVVQSGQGADEILAGYSWYPPLANVAREQTTEAYAKVFFDRSHDDVLSIFSPEYGIDADVSREFATTHQAAPGADSAVDAALRLDTRSCWSTIRSNASTP